jgi:hypothetical protein
MDFLVDNAHTRDTVHALASRRRSVCASIQSALPGHRLIDVEVRFTVIEVKKDLRSAAVIRDAKIGVDLLA